MNKHEKLLRRIQRASSPRKPWSYRDPTKPAGQLGTIGDVPELEQPLRTVARDAPDLQGPSFWKRVWSS